MIRPPRRPQTSSLLVVWSLVLITCGSSCSAVNPRAWTAGPYRGRVVDAETSEPIEGAVALVSWRRFYPMPFHATEGPFAARETVTGKDGRFSLPGAPLSWIPLTALSPPAFRVFKAGFDSFPSFLDPENNPPTASALLSESEVTIGLRKLKTKEEVRTVGILSDPGIREDQVPRFMEEWNAGFKLLEREDLN